MYFTDLLYAHDNNLSTIDKGYPFKHVLDVSNFSGYNYWKQDMQLHTHFLFVFDERFEWDDNKREFSDKTWNQLPV